MDKKLLQRKFHIPKAILILVGAICALIIIGLLVPIRSGPNNSSRAAAKNDAVQIANAIIAYRTEYNIPISGTHAEIIQVLVGNDILKNPHKIIFLDAPVYKPSGWFKAGRSGLKDGAYLDPWGNSYQIEERYPEKPKVISPGPNKIVESDKPSDDLRSWE